MARYRSSGKLLECGICFLTFEQKRSVRRHVERYERMMHQCKICDEKFFESDVMRSHYKSVHNVSPIKVNLKCPICDLEIHMERNFQAHLGHVHPGWENTMEINENTGKCDYRETTKIHSTMNDRDVDSIEMTITSKKQRVRKLIKHMVRVLPNGIEDYTSNIRVTRNNSKNESSSNIVESDSNNVSQTSNVVTAITPKRSKKRIRKNDEPLKRDAELRKLYSCTDCYVSLTRIHATKTMSMKDATINSTIDDSTVETGKMYTCVGTLSKESPSRSNHCKINRESLRTPKRRQTEFSKKRRRIANEKTEGIKLIDVKVNLERLPIDIANSETNDREKFVFPESTDNYYDPFFVKCKFEPDDRCIDETSMETMENRAQSFATTMEFVKSEPEESSTFATDVFENFRESSTTAFKCEPMDCDLDDYSTITTESFVLDYPITNDFSTKNESIYENSNEPATQFATTEFVNPESLKLENLYDPKTLSGSPDREIYPVNSQHPETSFTDSQTRAQTEQQPSLSTLNDRSETDEISTKVASKICDKTFVGRRALLRHAREKHLTSSGDTVYCICGKAMKGRRAMERHFSRHCGASVDPNVPVRESSDPCNPLDKKYVCEKCGSKFVLQSCLFDHPPNCEMPNHKFCRPIRPAPATATTVQETSQKIDKPCANDDEYRCEICKVQFDNYLGLERHKRLWTFELGHTCHFCNTQFPGQRLLRNHVQSTHPPVVTNSFTYSCDLCKQGFSKKKYRRIHMIHIHGVEPIDEIGMSYYTVYGTPTAKTNCPTYPDSDDNKCAICNLIFVNRKRYTEHLSYYDKTGIYSCNICGENFNGQYKAHQHRKTVHYNDKIHPRYTHCCIICKERFAYKTHLHAHMFHVHDDDYNCVSSIKDLGRPLVVAEKPPDEETPCVRCGKKFSNESLRFAHEYTHHGLNAMPGGVRCEICDERFSTWLEWSIHTKNKHANDSGDNSNRRFIDEVRKTSDECAIVEDSMENDKSSTICTTCGIDIPGHGLLAKHKAIYTNSGAYNCELCGRRFRWQSTLRDHKLKHFRRDVHNKCFCPVCDEGFENVRCLEMHAIHFHRKPLGKFLIDLLRSSSSIRDERSTSEKYRRTVLPNVVKANEVTANTNGNGNCHQNEATINANENSSNVPTCEFCNKIFVNVATLNTHLLTQHTFSERNILTTRESNGRSGDRFYVSLGDNVNPQLTDTIGKHLYDCKKTVEIARGFYRYDDSLYCGSCHLHFTTKYLLDRHWESAHSIEGDFRSAMSDVDRMENCSVVNAVSIASPATSQLVEITSDTAEIQRPSVGHLSTFETQRDDAINGDCSAIGEVTAAEDRSDLHPTTMIHENSVHGSTSSNSSVVESPIGFKKESDEAIDESTVKTEKFDPPSATQSAIVSHGQCDDSDVERACASRSPGKFVVANNQNRAAAGESSTTAKKLPLSGNKKIRLINLPPGNYKISKLKVRSVGMITGMVFKNTNVMVNRGK